MSNVLESATALFEAFVADTTPHCLEYSTRIEDARCHKHRVNAWFKRDRGARVVAALGLFDRIAEDSGAAFDVRWVREVAARIDPQAAKAVVVGTDFREAFAGSRLKLAFSYVDDARAVAVALGLGPVAAPVADAVRAHRLLFGVAIDGLGRRHVKLYPSFHLDGDDGTRFDRFARTHLDPSAAELAAQCRRVFVTEGAPYDGAPLVLHFRPRDLDGFLERGPFRSTAASAEARRHRGLGHRPLVVSAPVRELARGRVRTCNLYAFHHASRPG
jgi:LynF/TruF/PatF family peptide O-prenyltransferase